MSLLASSIEILKWSWRQQQERAPIRWPPQQINPQIWFTMRFLGFLRPTAHLYKGMANLCPYRRSSQPGQWSVKCSHVVRISPVVGCTPPQTHASEGDSLVVLVSLEPNNLNLVYIIQFIAVETMIQLLFHSQSKYNKYFESYKVMFFAKMTYRDALWGVDSKRLRCGA